MMFRVLPILAVLTLSLATALPDAPPIPPPGLFCCPPCGPNGLHLDRQQVGPFSIFCYYSPGTDLACFYDPGTGVGGMQTPGCITQAPSNPHPPTCPI